MTENGLQTGSPFPPSPGSQQSFEMGQKRNSVTLTRLWHQRSPFMGHYQGRNSQFFIWKLTAVSREICQLSPTFRRGITQTLRLEETFKTIESLLQHCQVHRQTMSPGVTSPHLFNTSRSCTKDLTKPISVLTLPATTAGEKGQCLLSGTAPPCKRMHWHSSVLECFTPCPACTSPFSGSCRHTT